MRRTFATGAAALSLILALLPSGTAIGAATGAAATKPATWKTWHLTSADQFRAAEPPAADSSETRGETRELRNLQSERNRKVRKIVARWNDGPAVIPWTKVTLQFTKDFRPRPPVSARVLAVVHTGLYDAMVAASDSRIAYPNARPAPSRLDHRIDPMIHVPKGSSYVPVEAAMAGAAEKILPYLFPAEDPLAIQELATEAVESRLWAGVNYRSDVDAARLLGNQVGAAVVEHMKTDGSPGAGPAHPRPAGESYWSPTAPGFEQPTGGPVGKWRPWLMSTGDQLRTVIPGPFPYQSEEFLAELHEVIDVQTNLTNDQQDTAYFWNDGPGTFTPAGHWFDIAIELVKDFHIGDNQTTRMFALLGATEADGAIAFFEAKYFWWSIRPISAVWRLCDGGDTLCTEQELTDDPSRATYRGTWFSIIQTPPFPSYPGGHSTFSGGAGKLLTYFIPEAGDTLNEFANAAAMSRLYGGIHYRSDNDAGLILGRAVADLAIQRAESDGSGP